MAVNGETSRRKRVAIISSQAFSLVNFRGTLITALAQRGVEVLAFAPDHDGWSRQQLQRIGATPVDYACSRAGLNPLRDGLDMLALARRLRALDVDATLGYFIKPATYGSIAAWIAGVRRRVVLVEGLGITFAQGQPGAGARARVLRRLVSGLYRFALHRVHKVFFLNAEDQAEFTAAGIADPKTAALLGGVGVDLDRFAAAPPVTKPVTFLMAARLLRAKGVAEFVAASRRLKRDHPDLRFVLLGDVDLNPNSFRPEEVRAWAEEGVVECPGHVAVDDWLERASVFVLPTYYREGVPRSLQEALAAGRAVVTTDIPGCRETVEDGINGFLVPPRDVDALARTMESFVNEPELIARFGRESRRIAEQRFDAREKDAVLVAALLDTPEPGDAGG